MKLRSLAVNQFKKFTSPTRLEGIEDGLNVVVGPNELGKSTLLDALRAALFEKYSSRAQPIVALQNDRNQAAPVVELAFELDDGFYRITKRFIKKPYARLSCPDGRSLEGDAAEDTLRDLLDFDEPGKTGAKPETLGMWNVLWVQQGHSFRALDLPESARSSLHSALESEVGTVLGGRRGRALPKAIENQLGELVTSTTNRPRGTYKELIDRVDTIRQEVGALCVRREDLTQTLVDLEDAQEILERLSTGDRDQADRKELDEARHRHSQLAELEARIEAARTERELRKRTLEQAEQAAKARKRLKADVETEKAALGTAELRLGRAREQEKEARSKVDALRGSVRRSEAAVTKADEAVSRHRRVLGAAERQARLRDLEGRYEKAQAAEKLQREAQQAAAAILVTDEAIEGIRKAAQGLETNRGRLNAAATHISFDMTEDGISGIDVDGEPLTADRRSVQSVEPVTITVPERGRITVEPAIRDPRQTASPAARCHNGVKGSAGGCRRQIRHRRRRSVHQAPEAAAGCGTCPAGGRAARSRDGRLRGRGTGAWRLHRGSAAGFETREERVGLAGPSCTPRCGDVIASSSGAGGRGPKCARYSACRIERARRHLGRTADRNCYSSGPV